MLPLPSNEDRANWATEAIDAFKVKCGPGLSDKEAIQDLITDLGHLADRLGLDFLAVAAHGIGAWSAEREDPDPRTNDLVDIHVRRDDFYYGKDDA